MINNFQTTNLMLGLFLRKFEVEDFQEFAESLPWRLPEFDGPAETNPQTQNVRPDTPRVRFSSKDQRLFLEVAPAKIHFRMMPGEIKKTEQGANIQALPIDKAFEALVPQAEKVYEALAEHYGAVANRVGIVTDMIAPTPSSSNQKLHKILLNGTDLLGERLQECNVAALTKTTLEDGVNINRRITLRPMRSGAEGNPDNILGVNIDINTVADEPYDIDAPGLSKFLANASEHLNKKVPLFHNEELFQ